MNVLGMNATTGLRITGDDHLHQSLQKILTTAMGTRLRRRTFGSLAPDLLDAPNNPATLLQLYSATAASLLAWEPRITVRSLAAHVDTHRPNALILDIHAERITGNTASPVRLSVTLGQS